MDSAASASVFKEWNKGPLNSYLIEITGYVLEAVEPVTVSDRGWDDAEKPRLLGP
jgi:6-phosphogluconate dehydrogenase